MIVVCSFNVSLYMNAGVIFAMLIDIPISKKYILTIYFQFQKESKWKYIKLHLHM